MKPEEEEEETPVQESLLGTFVNVATGNIAPTREPSLAGDESPIRDIAVARSPSHSGKHITE